MEACPLPKPYFTFAISCRRCDSLPLGVFILPPASTHCICYKCSKNEYSAKIDTNQRLTCDIGLATELLKSKGTQAETEKKENSAIATKQQGWLNNAP